MLRRLGWIIATLILALLLSSIVRSTDLPVCVATLLLCTVAVAHPAHALLIALAFSGLGNILRVFAGMPTLRVEEILVLAALFGCCVRSLFDRAGTQRAFVPINARPVMLFGLTVACSAAVWMRVDQVQTTYPSWYLADLWHSVSTEYLRMDRFFDVISTAALLESLALYLAVASMCHRDRTFAMRALRMLIVGGAAVAALSVVRLLEITLRNPTAIAMLRTTGPGLRISPQIADYIAAAAYFGLCWTTAMGFALQRSRQRVYMLAAALLLLAGLFLTGSRSAVGAAIAGICVLSYLVARSRNVTHTRAVIGVAVLVLAVFAIMFSRLIGHDLTGTTAGESLKVRVELIKVGMDVLETHPLFGVGLDRFFLYLDRFASPQLKTMWFGRLNPHNDFVRTATEFGLVGLVLFVWTLASSARRIAQSWSDGVDARLAGLIGGLTAFLITMFISNPLMVHSVSYVFWAALGLATGEATARAVTTSRETVAPPNRGWRQNAPAAVCACVIVASVPFRAAHEIAAANLAGVTYGLSDWTTSPDGVPSRLSGAQATLFVPADARVVEFSLTGTLPTDRIQTVQAFVDGRLANELSVGREPQRLRILLPNQTGHARRIDFHVSPTWTPADVDPSSDDRRTRGVRIGQVALLRGTAGGR